MNNLKDRILKAVQCRAEHTLAQLANEYIHALPEEKEAIQAGIDFERWLAETCDDCW